MSKKKRKIFDKNFCGCRFLEQISWKKLTWIQNKKTETWKYFRERPKSK